MPRKHDLTSPAFLALYNAWAERWAIGAEVSETIVAEAATETLNATELRSARFEGRDPQVVAFGVMRDRFGHLIRIGRVGTRERGYSRRSALSLNVGTVPVEEATLRQGVEAYLTDPFIGKPAKDSVISALRFIMRPDLLNGAPALLKESEQPAYGADRLTLLHAQVEREWRLRRDADVAGQPIPGRGRVSDQVRDNHRSALKRLLIWAGTNGHLPMVASGQGSVAWHEKIAQWFGSGSGLTEDTRRTYGANARLFVELLAEVYGTDRPEPTELTWTHVEAVLEHLYRTGRPRVMQRIAHIANAISNCAAWTPHEREIPGLAPRAESDDVALPAPRGQTPTTWKGLDAFLGQNGLGDGHPLRAFLRYHGTWCTTESTDRSMPRRRRRQRMGSAQSESRRMHGLRTWLGMACRVHNCGIQDLTLSQAFGLEADTIVDELTSWWLARADDEDDEAVAHDITSQGFQGFLIAGEQAMGLLQGVLLLSPERTRRLSWLSELTKNERAVRQGHDYVRTKLAEIQERSGGPLRKDLDEIVARTGPLWWMRVRDEAVAEVRRIQAAIGEKQPALKAALAKCKHPKERRRLLAQLINKELLERAHDCFALLLIIATMGRGREYTTVRLDRHARAFGAEGRIEWLKCDTKNRVERTGIADATWLPHDVREFYLAVVRPTLIDAGKTTHKQHQWLLLVPGTGAPLGDPNEVMRGSGKEIQVKRDDTLITRNLSAFRQRLWCLTVELALAAKLDLPPRRLYGALTLHAIRANLAFAGALVHSIEIAAGLLGDTISTAEHSYASLRTRHLKLRPQLIAAGYTLPDEVVTAAVPVAEAAPSVVAPSAHDPFAQREQDLLDTYVNGDMPDEEYERRCARLRRARQIAGT